MKASSTVDAVTDSASDLAQRAQDFASDILLPRLSAAAESARPVLEKAAERAQQTANDTVLPALQSTATTVAESAREHGLELWERVAATEQAQELARRATLVASGSKGETPKRWPLLVAGLGVGVLLGALLGRRTAATPPPAAVEPANNDSAGTFPA